MTRTARGFNQIKTNSITGANINSGVRIFDERANYPSRDKVFWANGIYQANTAITGGAVNDFTNAPDVSSDWVLVTEYLAVDVDYDDTEDWIFDYMELKLSASITVTIPASGSANELQEGERRFFQAFTGNGANTATIDLNGYTLDGGASNPIIEAGGYLEIVQTCGELRTLRQRNCRFAFKQRTFNLPVARNSTNVGSNQDLRRQNGTSTNSAPYIVPFKCKLTAMVGGTDRNAGNETWDLILYKNNAAEYTLAITNKIKETADNLDAHTFAAGDEIRIRAMNMASSLRYPHGNAFFEEII